MTDEVLPQPKPLNKIKILLSRTKRRILKYTWAVRAMILGTAILSIYLLFLTTSFIFGKTILGNLAGLTYDFVFTPKEKIEAIDGRTNILILGKGGKGHDAPDLTDTIIFVSISHLKPEVKLISLPRDIWITELRSKLNSIYYWGNQKKEGGGTVLAKSVVEQISGEKMQYGVVIDFSAFKEIIDVLGGVSVEVEREFTDEKYPIVGREDDECEGDLEFKCRFETIHFEKGLQLMDGETALKYVRSRNAEGDEGTDFARNNRQQKIISAISQKILSSKVLMSPKTLLRLLEIAEDSLETDIDDSAGAILARRIFSARNGLNSFVLPEEFLVNPPISQKYDNLYVFIPKEGNWSAINLWFNCKIRGVNCS